MRVNLQALALFFVGIAMSASDEAKIQDITLVKCPQGKDGKYCRDEDKAQVLPGKLGAAPGYRSGFNDFLLLWEWPYQLSWRSVDGGAVNVTIRAANYTLHKGKLLASLSATAHHGVKVSQALTLSNE